MFGEEKKRTNRETRSCVSTRAGAGRPSILDNIDSYETEGTVHNVQEYIIKLINRKCSQDIRCCFISSYSAIDIVLCQRENNERRKAAPFNHSRLACVRTRHAESKVASLSVRKETCMSLRQGHCLIPMIDSGIEHTVLDCVIL